MRLFVPLLLICVLGCHVAGAVSVPVAGAKPKSEDKRPPQLVNPLLSGVYDGSARRVLATCRTGLELNEETYLLFALLTENPEPALFHELSEEEDPDKRDILAQRLKRSVSDCLYRLSVASQSPATPPPGHADHLVMQTWEYPVHEFVWIHRVLWPRIEVSPQAERFYYLNHPEEFVTPRRAAVRYIFRRIDETYSETDIVREEQLIEALRQNLEETPEQFLLAAQQYSQAPSAAVGGLIPSFESGDSFDAFERMVFNQLRPGEISEVVRGPKGLYLIQLVKLTLPEPIPFESAGGQLAEAVRVQETRARFVYEIGRLRRKAHIENRFAAWDRLLDDSIVLRVGETKVTKGDFLRMYPSILKPDGSLDQVEFGRRSARLAELEMIRQDLERRGLTNDPRIIKARELSAALTRANLVEREWVAERLRLSTEESAEYVQEEIASAQFPPAKRLFRVWAELKNPRLYDATTLANLREHLPRALQSRLEANAAEFGEETAERAGEVPFAVRRVRSGEDAHYEFSWTDMGYVNVNGLPALRDLLRGVRPGCFSPVERQGEAAAAYYVGAEKKTPPGLHDSLEAFAQRKYAEEAREKIVGVYRDATVQGLGVVFHFP